MDKNTLEEIIACLPKDRTLFHYAKDRYAPLLLSYVVGAGAKISDLRRSPFSRLLDKASVKQIIAASGDGMVRAEPLVSSSLCAVGEPFILTLAHWCGKQTSRTGECGYNLVLQLNFSNKHDTACRRLLKLKPAEPACFNYSGHPVRKLGQHGLFRETLAWARIDLDFAAGEALIEEIQSDWIKSAQWLAGRAETRPEIIAQYGLGASVDDLKRYVTQVLAPYARIWDEAMLMAAIHFIRVELGLRRIYYHDFATSLVLKELRHCPPPRSLYTDLPRQFCFRKVEMTPVFLRNDKQARWRLKWLSAPRFQLLEL
ncbi:MAG: hypothetical protein U1F68_06945 [Gammaproteobacteria bacterium]